MNTTGTSKCIIYSKDWKLAKKSVLFKKNNQITIFSFSTQIRTKPHMKYLTKKMVIIDIN